MSNEQSGSVTVSGGAVGVVSTGAEPRIHVDAGHIGGIARKIDQSR